MKAIKARHIFPEDFIIDEGKIKKVEATLEEIKPEYEHLYKDDLDGDEFNLIKDNHLKVTIDVIDIEEEEADYDKAGYAIEGFSVDADYKIIRLNNKEIKLIKSFV